jgi:hypothetical protein
MRPITFILSIFLMLTYGQASGDVSFNITPASSNAAVGTQVTFTVAVNGFVDIGTFQFALDYDETKLQFMSATCAPLSGIASDTTVVLVNPSNPPVGFTNRWLATTYIDLTSVGRTLTNGTVIMTLRFNTIATGVATLQFNGSLNPTPVVGNSVGDPFFNVAVTPTSYTASITPPQPPAPFTMELEKDTIAPGGSTCVKVTTKGFKDMVAFQTGIAYDTTKLVFDNILLGANPLNIPNNLQVIPLPGPKQIRLNFTAPTTSNGTPIPVTLADNTELFSVCFTTATTATGTGIVKFSEFDLPSSLTHEFTNVTGIIPNPILNNGHVVFNGTPPQPPAGMLRLKIEQDSAMANETVCLDVRAFSFINVQDFNTGIAYDTTRLTYSSISFGANPLNNPDNLQVIQLPVQKQIRVNYAAPQPGGNPAPPVIADSTILFTICFTVKNTSVPGSIAPVVFSEFDLPSVLTHGFNSPAGPITNFTLQNGSVKVTGTQSNPCANSPSIPTSTIVNPGVSCFGGSNGSIAVFPTGGATPYTVTWTGPGSYTATGASISGLSAGTYTPTVRDANGCSTVGVNGTGITVTAPTTAVDVVVNNITSVSCFGLSNGGIDVSVTGGSMPYRYEWRRGSTLVDTMQDLTNATAGTYGLTVTDNRGCTDWANGNIITSPAALPTNFNPATVNVTCNGGNNGFLTIAPSGGPYTYTWSPAQPNSANLSGLTAGSYTVTISNSAGCTRAGGPFVVNQPQPVTFPNTITSPSGCANQNTGCITINPTGGNGAPYSAIWNNSGLAGTMICNLAPGSYVATVSDVLGCSAITSPISVTTQQPIVINNPVVTNQTGSVANGSITLTSVTGGTGNITYLWSNLANTQNISGLAAGTYTVVVTDANGCSTSATYTVGLTSQSTASVVSVVNSCNGTGCVTIATTGLSLPFIVSYLDNGTTITAPASTETFTICGLSNASFTFSILDANSMVKTVDATVLPGVPAIVSSTITNVTIDNVGGSIKLTPHPIAPGVYTYLWNTGQTTATITNLDAGVYCATVTNTTSGCTTVQCDTVRYPAPVFSVTNAVGPTCAGLTNGTITLQFTGANGPNYHYVVSDQNSVVFDFSGTVNQVSIADLPAGTYFPIVIDESNDTFQFNVTVLQTQSQLTATGQITSSYQGFDVSGATPCDGSVTITSSLGVTPYQYQWSNSQAANNPVNSTLCAGAYAVTVTDGVGCSVALSGVLAGPSALVATGTAQSSYSGFNVTCNGENDGIARVVAIGGIDPYIVTWSTGQVDTIVDMTDHSDIFGLTAGVYTYTLKDAVGVQTTGSVTITEPDQLELDFTVIEPANFATCDGIITVFAPGAAGISSITWVSKGNSGTGAKVENLCAGQTVDFILVDANGCRANGTDTVPFPKDGCLEMSPVITPGIVDEKNDQLYIACIEAAQNNQVEIFNRWGQLVFDQKPYVNADPVRSWSGLNKSGQALPEGVYFIVLTYTDTSGETIVKKTYINLLRP